MKKNSKPQNQLKSTKTFIRLAKDRGAIHIAKWSGNPNNVAYYSLNFIDGKIAPPSANCQVVAYHHGHDHGYGIYHKHHHSWKTPQNLGINAVWNTSVINFLADVDGEEITCYGSSTAFLTPIFLIKFVDDEAN